MPTYIEEITTRELDFLRLRFVEGMTVAAIASAAGITGSRVQQLIHQGARRLVARELWNRELAFLLAEMAIEDAEPVPDQAETCWSCAQPLGPDALRRRAEEAQQAEARAIALRARFEGQGAVRAGGSNIVHLVVQPSSDRRYYGRVDSWIVCGGSGAQESGLTVYGSLDEALDRSPDYRVCVSCSRSAARGSDRSS